MPVTKGALTRQDRLRRVMILCCSFARNHAYYSVGRDAAFKSFYAKAHPYASFWIQANGNFIDMCVLEWCKLFGERGGKHHWSQIVRDQAVFEAGLLAYIGIEGTAFEALITEMRIYRDKFIAHLDSECIMNIPFLDRAWAGVRYYQKYLVEREAEGVNLSNLPETAEKFQLGHDQCVNEARQLFGTQMRA